MGAVESGLIVFIHIQFMDATMSRAINSISEEKDIVKDSVETIGRVGKYMRSLGKLFLDCSGVSVG